MSYFGQARKMAFVSGFLSITFVPATAIVGLIARTFTPNITGGSSAWLAFHISPLLGVVMLVLLLSATISTADSLLNSAAINIVNDAIRPFKPNIDDQELIKWTRICSVVCGLISIIGTFYFTRILDLSGFGYTIAGAVVIPLLFLVGTLIKKQVYSSSICPHFSNLRCTFGPCFQIIPSLSKLLGGHYRSFDYFHCLLFGYFSGGEKRLWFKQSNFIGIQ